MPDRTDDAGELPDDAAHPTCYRHRDRETYVRCNRCDKYICPDCMHTASVGFHCPDCVREGNKTVRQHQTIFGGKVAGDGLVTRVLIGICAAAFVLQIVDGSIVDTFAELPARAGFIDTGAGIKPFADGVAAFEFYRVITAAFLHGNLLHIAFNMYALFMFGTQVENHLGRVRYTALYFVSALGGSALSYYLADVGPGPGLLVTSTTSLGASGAVFGLFGAYYVLAKRLRADTGQIVGLIVINLVIGFVVPQIDYRAHIGGLITGFAVMTVLAKVPRGPRRGLIQAAAVAGIALVVIAVIGVRTVQLRDEFPVLRGSNAELIEGALPPAR